MKSCIGLVAIVTIVTFAPNMSFATEPAAPENLSTLISSAISDNPELKSSESRWRMFASKARQASSLDDPMLMLKFQNMLVREPFSFNKDSQTAKVIGISQQLPFWGKRALREEIAQYEAESYRWSIEERKLELTRMVKEAWYRIYTVDRSLEIIDKNLRVMDDFITIAETKYSVGQGAQQDIYKAGLEKSKMLDMQITLQQQRKSLEANLNYLLYRSEPTPVGPIPDFDLPLIPLSAGVLNETAYEKRPQIKSLINLANKGQASHRLAEKEYWPDFNLSLEYMLKDPAMGDPGYDMYTVGVTFNLPLQRERRHAMLAESSSEAAMSMEELNGLKNSIGYAINDSLAQMERRRKLAELYRNGIIPQAEQSLESAIISYRVNKVDFLTLLDSRVNLFNYERELYEAKSEYMMQLARLEATVGMELTGK